ncbi:MAG: hypothetical protein B7Y72_02685 [Mehylophilales bacterium 35-46-6]|nr:MAG: hypothetical protein B7Y72_02685 [Mehylophilales bacterium 35-46-6]
MNKENEKTNGIDLRDYFAGIAMGAYIQLDPNIGDGQKEKRELFAKRAYLCADALLKVREETEQA